MRECSFCNCRGPEHPKPLSIRLHPIPPNEKAAYVKSVCDILLESRFGPGRTSQLIVNLSDRPEIEQAVFFDMSDAELVPCYAISPLGRKGYQVMEAVFRRLMQMEMNDARRSEIPAARSPATLSRGSPTCQKPH